MVPMPTRGLFRPRVVTVFLKPPPCIFDSLAHRPCSVAQFSFCAGAAVVSGLVGNFDRSGVHARFLTGDRTGRARRSPDRRARSSSHLARAATDRRRVWDNGRSPHSWRADLQFAPDRAPALRGPDHTGIADHKT